MVEPHYALQRPSRPPGTLAIKEPGLSCPRAQPISPVSWSKAHTREPLFADTLHLKGGEQTISRAQRPRSSFNTQRSVHCESLFPLPPAGPRGGRNKSKYRPDGPGKRGFGKRMFVQNLPKIENQGEEESTS